MMRRTTLGATVLLTLAGAHAHAQDTTFSPVDRIAAIVGERVITVTRVEEETNVLRSQGVPVPTDPTQLVEFKREILRQLINQELMVQAALRDTTVIVTEQEVQDAVDRAYREVRNQYVTDAEFRAGLLTSGFGGPEEYRQWLADQQRRDLLQQQLLSVLSQRGDLSPLPPTEEELRAFYEQTREQQPRRPATVSLRQIVTPSEGDSSAVTAAFLKADSLARELRGGADFAVAARRFSDDPGSREQGGDLGWVRRGMLVPEFERMAFQIRPGAISPPLRTEFGFHIIQVQRSQPAEVQVRHILVAPLITEADRGRARARAEEIAQALLDGAPYDSLADLYHDPTGQEPRLVEDVPNDQLPPTYRDAIAGASVGSIVGPIVLDRGDGRPKYAVVRVEEMRPEGEYSFEDLRTQLFSALSEQNAMERLLRSLRRATFIEIRY